MKRLSLTILILLIVFSLQPVFAQGPPPPPPDGGGVDDILPINFLVYPLLLLGIFIGYLFTKKSSN